MMNIMLCISVLVFASLNITCADCQNAIVAAIPAEATPGDSITLTCNYIGTGNVSAVLWFNGSNSDVLILKPGSIVPECHVFLTTNTSYDPTRLSYKCDKARNTYTLRINPVRAVDANIKWSCTFQDPQPNAKRAEYTILLRVVSDGDKRDLSDVSTLTIALVITLVFLCNY